MNPCYLRNFFIRWVVVITYRWLSIYFLFSFFCLFLLTVVKDVFCAVSGELCCLLCCCDVLSVSVGVCVWGLPLGGVCVCVCVCARVYLTVCLPKCPFPYSLLTFSRLYLCAFRDEVLSKVCVLGRMVWHRGGSDPSSHDLVCDGSDQRQLGLVLKTRYPITPDHRVDLRMNL